MRLFCLLLMLLAVPAFADSGPAGQAPGGDHQAVNAATAESRDAARLEQQDLRDRENALREQNRTTKALLDKQEQYLQALREKIRKLKQDDQAGDAPR